MSYEIISENELRVKLSEWILRNVRCYSYFRDEDLREGFIRSYRIPNTVFKHVISYTTDENIPISIFKTTVHLESFKTYSGDAKDFLYYRISEIIPVEGAKLPDFKLMGYIIPPDATN